LIGLLDPEDGDDVPPKRRLILNGKQDIISQKIVLFRKRFTTFAE
jgi:hypothetical protein